jgi:hypothetical protein
MAFDFPASPTTGQIYAPAGGPQYVFDGQKWKTVGTALTAQARNRIVNPAMQVSQENANAAGTTSIFYPADQWFMNVNTTGAVSLQRVQVVTPNGSRDRLRLTVTTADTSLTTTENLYIAQHIEGLQVADFQYGTAAAKQCVLRFGWKSPAGTYSVALRNGGGDRCYVANFTITAGQTNTDTVQSLVIPGDITGTWTTDATLGLRLNFSYAMGSGFVGPGGVWQAGSFLATASNSNGLATVGNVFELFDVGLHLDLNNTGLAPAWQLPDFADELLRCMHYYQKTTAYWSGSCTSGFDYYLSYKYGVLPRASPTLAAGASIAGNFPTAAGSLADLGSLAACVETRRASATASQGFFRADITVNARM